MMEEFVDCDDCQGTGWLPTVHVKPLVEFLRWYKALEAKGKTCDLDKIFRDMAKTDGEFRRVRAGCTK